MAQKQSLVVPFPLLGINENWAFGRQPEGTTPDAQNVVPFDPIDSRARGGQRWGTSKYFSAQHNGSNALQRLSSNVLSAVDTQVAYTFTQANGVLDDTSWWPCLITFPTASISASYPHVKSNAITLNNADTPGSIWAAAFHKTAQISSGVFEIKADVTLVAASDGYNYAGFISRCATPSFPNFSLSNWMDLRLEMWNDGGTYKFQLSYAGVVTNAWRTATPGSGDWLDPTWWATARELKVRIEGGLISFYAAGTLMEAAYQRGAVGSYTGLYVGFHCWKNDKAGNTVTMDNWTFDNLASESSRDYKLVAVSGGDVYTGRPIELLTLATSGENVLSTTGIVGAQPAFGVVYFCDGVNANYSKWTASTNTVAAWTPDSGALPVSGTQGARYITLYRGRIVMAGLQGDPHNWFMSAVGDPLDWDYSPATTSATMAVAGNSTDAGECSDIITCLASYSDDLMFIGGDHTLWLMRGDPASGGVIDNVSYQTGIAGPDAYTFDPNGTFYFFGSGTVWRMAAGGIPEPLSRNRMDKTFKDIDLTTDTVHLAWDNVRHGLFIFIVPSTEGSTTHYYWDERTNSFWKIIIPDAQGPTTVLAFDGDNPDDNALILGGFDGYLRKFDSSVTDDDGTAISSYVLYPPITMGGSSRNTKVNQIVIVLDTNSDGVVLTAYAEETAQKAIESSTARFVRTLLAGRTRIISRLTGNTIMLRLSNSVDETTWAVESLVVNAEVTGKSRKGHL